MSRTFLLFLVCVSFALLSIGAVNHSSPALSFSSFLGGRSGDYPFAITTDPSGFVYVVGYTRSPNFPKLHPFQANKGGEDAFVTKIDPVHSRIVYSTYLGGNSMDFATGVAADSFGNAYVVGGTESVDFPTLNAIQPHKKKGVFDIFITKLSPSGSPLYSTYLGGSSDDYAASIAVNSAGEAYVTGDTYSKDFPIHNALQPSLSGSSDAFVIKLNATGTALIYSTYIGGVGDDLGEDIGLDPLQRVYITGTSWGSGFPLKNAFQSQISGTDGDAFIAVMNPSGSGLVYSTYLGGSGMEDSAGIAVDPLGNASVVGATTSGDFPIRKPVWRTPPVDGFSTFVAKFRPGGSLVYSTYWPTGQHAKSSDVAMDAAGNTYITGSTDEKKLPTVDPIQTNKNFLWDCFITEFNSAGSKVLFSTYLGGSFDDNGMVIDVDSHNNIHVAGETRSPDFPVHNPFQAKYGSGGDVFLARITP